MKKKVQSSKSRLPDGQVKVQSGHPVERIKRDFPILNKKGRKLIYLDSASTSLKPKQVIKAVTSFYEQYTANVHRGIYKESEEATQRYEDARNKVARFINAEKEEIIFTKNTTEAINLVAKTWGEANIKTGSKIVSSVMEHHSNLVPWQELVKGKGEREKGKLVFLDINDSGQLELDGLDRVLKGASLVAITHVSNVLGTINPVEEIVKKAHQARALVLIDGAQAVPHLRVDVKKIGCDFYAFSGHKMLGPSGVGVLWMKKDIAQVLPPFLTGGGMISRVTLQETAYLDTPRRFEAGTPNIEGVIGLGSAIDYLESLGMEKIRQDEIELTEYALRKLAKIKGLTLYGSLKASERVSVISFNIAGIHPHDLASMLDRDGIAIRAGHHCAMPLHARLGITASARISLYIYNTREDIDRLVEALDAIDFEDRRWILEVGS